MRLSTTLLMYLGRQFLVGIGVALSVLLTLVVLFDFVELLRRGSGRETATVGVLLQMALLKMPFMAQKVLPFATLFGGMLTFLRLTRTQELVVARAAGVSVWQFLMPALLIAGLLGVFVVAAFNPLASITVSRYEQLETKHLRGRPSLLAVSGSGIWLRQADGDAGQSVIHAQHVSGEGKVLENVIVFLYRGTDQFVRRIDARRAQLDDGAWLFEDVMLTDAQGMAEFRAYYSLPTTLTVTQIQESFASPETMSFWALPKFIKMLEGAGFTALKHRLHWHSVLAGPLLLAAMVLVAATFSLRFTRHRGTGLLVIGCVLAGFVLYFLSDVVFAIGLSGGIPVVLAAWTPAGVSTLLGLATLFYLEDG